MADLAAHDPANGVENVQTLSVLGELQLANGKKEEGEEEPEYLEDEEVHEKRLLDQIGKQKAG